MIDHFRRISLALSMMLTAKHWALVCREADDGDTEGAVAIEYSDIDAAPRLYELGREQCDAVAEGDSDEDEE